MPMMKRRSGDQPLQRAEAPGKVGVNKIGPVCKQDRNSHRHRIDAGGERLSQSKNVERNGRAEMGEENIDGMSLGGDQPVEFLGAVMNRVESPQKRNFMRPAVAP